MPAPITKFQYINLSRGEDRVQHVDAGVSPDIRREVVHRAVSYQGQKPLLLRKFFFYVDLVDIQSGVMHVNMSASKESDDLRIPQNAELIRAAFSVVPDSQNNMFSIVHSEFLNYAGQHPHVTTMACSAKPHDSLTIAAVWDTAYGALLSPDEYKLAEQALFALISSMIPHMVTTYLQTGN